jgi:hypothetical protein
VCLMLGGLVLPTMFCWNDGRAEVRIGRKDTVVSHQMPSWARYKGDQ